MQNIILPAVWGDFPGDLVNLKKNIWLNLESKLLRSEILFGYIESRRKKGFTGRKTLLETKCTLNPVPYQ